MEYKNYKKGSGFRGKGDWTNSLLPKDDNELENIILTLADQFNIRLANQERPGTNPRSDTAILVTTGLALLGGYIGSRYEEPGSTLAGAAIGGVVGLGLSAVAGVSLRDIWQNIRYRVSQLFDVVYQYTSQMGIQDYAKLLFMLTTKSETARNLAQLIVKTLSQILGMRFSMNA